MIEKKKFFGWRMVFVFFTMMFIIYPSLMTGISVFTKPVCNELGFDSTTFLLYNTIKSVFTIFATLSFNKISQKFGMKFTLFLGVVASFVGLLGFSFSKALTHFYFFSSFMGLGIGYTCMVAPSVVLTNWFNEKRGTAIGIALSGTGVGGSVYSPLMTKIIYTYGWRTAYLVNSIAILIIITAILFLLFKEKPEDVNQEPYGRGGKVELYGVGTHEMLVSKSFMWFAFSILLINVISNGFIINYANYFEGLGYAPERASMFLSMGLLFITFGKLLLGSSLDRLGNRNTGIILGVILIIEMMALSQGKNILFAMIFNVLCGITAAGCTMFPPVFTEDLFGNFEFWKKYGIVAMLMSASTGLSPIIVNLIKNIFNSLQVLPYAFLVFSCLYILAILNIFGNKMEMKK